MAFGRIYDHCYKPYISKVCFVFLFLIDKIDLANHATTHYKLEINSKHNLDRSSLWTLRGTECIELIILTLFSRIILYLCF